MTRRCANVTRHWGRQRAGVAALLLHAGLASAQSLYDASTFKPLTVAVESMIDTATNSESRRSDLSAAPKNDNAKRNRAIPAMSATKYLLQ